MAVFFPMKVSMQLLINCLYKSVMNQIEKRFVAFNCQFYLNLCLYCLIDKFSLKTSFIFLLSKLAFAWLQT